MAAPQRTKRRYGLPWAGYQSSAAPHLVAADKATSDGPSSARRSSNFLYSPLEGKFYRRAGMSVAAGASGVLEDGTGELTVARCRQLLSLRSDSLLDGYPSFAGLFTQESTTANLNKGCVYLRSTNTVPTGPTDYVLGKEWNISVHYPEAANTASLMKILPYMRTTDGTLGRFNTIALRALAATGSRRVLEVGDRLFAPNLTGTPWYWNKKYNEDSTDTADILRVAHTGSPSPLGMIDITTGTVNAAGTWKGGDIFFASVAYRFADGSVSMPIIPRDTNPDVNWNPGANMSAFGKVTLGAGSNYDYITWTRIPIGPDGCIGRYLLRSPKNAAGVGTEPSTLDLRITDYLPNNTQTAYSDYNGNDLALQTDPLLVRFDHIMQPPARYISAVDGRIIVGYTKPNPIAIYLCPDLNVTDNAATIDDDIYEFLLAGGVLTLKKNNSAGTAITCDNTKTLQYVVDKINNTTAAGSGGKWWAAIAPGADRAALCSTAAAANDNLTSMTAQDVGDSKYVTIPSARMRCYGSSFPGVIFYSTTYLANYPTNKRQIAFTMGGPGMPPNAANSWAAGNLRSAPESWGDYMGSAPLKSGAVVCFSKAIGVFQNRKGGTSGLDEDYRIYDLNLGRGCIAWDSIVEFNGAVGYLTADGFVVTDGSDEVVISGDVWNNATQVGEWAYEVGQCARGTASDTDIARFSAKVMGGRLYVSFRLTGSARSAPTDAHPLHWMVYDFTGSQQFSGMRGVLRSDGTPWGWSTPLTSARSVGPFCEVVTTAGVTRYTADEDATAQNANGRIYLIETGTQDSSVDVVAALWTARDLADHLKKKSVQEVTKIYKKDGTGMTFLVYRDGLGSTADATITLATTGSNKFTRAVLPLPQEARAAAESLEFKLADTGTTNISESWGFEADLLLLDSYT